MRGGLACTLRKLSLDENHIHDLGPLAPCHLAHLNAAFNPLDMAHLAASLEAGALPALRSVYLTVHQLPSPVESQHGQSVPLGSAPARLLRLLRARLVALGSPALPVRGPGHWVPSHCLGCSSQPPPKPPISPPLTM